MCEWSENYPDENTIAFDLNNGDLFVMKNDKKEIVATISIDHDDAVRIFLCGDKTSRIKRIMDKHGISESKAKSLVEETDAADGADCCCGNRGRCYGDNFVSAGMK